MEKLCVFCEHFNWEGIDYKYYSTLTGGSIDGGMGCRMGYFSEERPDDTEDFRRIILKAEKCDDYTPPLAPQQDEC